MSYRYGKKKFKKRPGTCRNCGIRGHWADTCVKPKKRYNRY